MNTIFSATYNKLKNRLSTEIIEPAWGWGFRVGIAVIVPMIVGTIMNNTSNIIWMVIAAETVSITELKGSAGLRSRLLLGALLLSVPFTFVGSIAGPYFWLSIALMFVIAFISGMMKTLGDWGLAIALNMYLFYMLSQAHPTHAISELWERCMYVGLGGMWALIVGVLSFSFLPQGKPYRRTIAGIWKAVANLMRLVEDNWNPEEKKHNIRAIYLKEKAIRAAIDESLALYGELYDPNKKTASEEQNLIFSRKCASMASMQIIAISENTNALLRKPLEKTFVVQMHKTMTVLQQISERMEYYFYTLKEEEWLLLSSRLERLKKFSTNLAELPDAHRYNEAQSILQEISNFSEWIENSLEAFEGTKEKLIISSYSFAQAINILHPKYLINNIAQLFHFDNLNVRYALRMAVAASFGLFISKYFFPDHGYWVPMTVMIVSQPFFGATLKKGIERSIGTIVGVIVGTLLMMLPFEMLMRYILTLSGAILMIYNLRKNYAWSAFFITIFLIGLLSTEHHLSQNLLFIRIISTILGAALAIVSGFALLPIWDKDLLPKYLNKAMLSNYQYFLRLLHPHTDKTKNWVEYKITAETANSNAYDSLNRYISEPTISKKKAATHYYTIITLNIRITRELNNFAIADTIVSPPLSDSEFVVFMELVKKIEALFEEIATFANANIIPFEADEALKHFLKKLNPTTQHWDSLERMQIELKALCTSLSA